MIGGTKKDPVEVKLNVNGTEVTFQLEKITYPEGTGYYNWGELDTAEKWARDSKCTFNSTLEKAGDSTGYYNNGLYLSANPADSEVFGAFAVRVDIKQPGGSVLLDLKNVLNDEAELKKYFTARGNYSEDNDGAVNIYNNQLKAALLSKKTNNQISQEEYDRLLNEINNKKYTEDGVKEVKTKLFEKAKKHVICDVTHAIGHEKLDKLGVIGVTDTKGRNGWVNIISQSTPHTVRLINSSDFTIKKEFDWSKEWTKTENFLKKLFSVDLKVPLSAVDIGKIDFVKEAFYKDPMTKADIEMLLKSFKDGIEEKSVWDPHAIYKLNPGEKIDNNIQNRIMRNSMPYIKTPLQDDLYKVVTQFMKDNPDYKLPNSYTAIYRRLTQTHQSGLTPEEQELRVDFLRNGPVDDPFLKPLIYGLNFIDSNDYLRKMALDDGAPWAAYDGDALTGYNLDKWQKVIHMPHWKTSTERVKPASEAIADIFKTFRDKSNIEFRGHPVVAGGGYDSSGKLMIGKDTSDGQGYIRGTQEQINALKANPLITVLETIDVEPVEGAGVLFRYRYPDARDYEKLKDLAPEFYQAIQKEINVKGHDEVDKLLNQTLTGPQAWEREKDPNKLAAEHAFSYKYTSMLIGELFKQVDDKLSPETRYQTIMTLHPFFDMNGRAARAFYQIETGKPLMLKNWDEDILCTPGELRVKLQENISDWARFVGEWKKESVQAFVDRRAPSYYEQPQIWLRHANIDPNQYTASERKEIMYALRDIYKSHEFYELQEKKAWFDCQALIKEKIAPTLNKINEPKMKDEPKKDQRVKMQTPLREISALRGEEKPAAQKGVVIEEPSPALQRLRSPEQKEKIATKDQQKKKSKQHVLHGYGAQKDLGKPLANQKNAQDQLLQQDVLLQQEITEKVNQEVDSLMVNSTKELATGFSGALGRHIALVESKIDDHSKSNVFSYYYTNIFYPTYQQDLVNEHKLLKDAKQLLDAYIADVDKNVRENKPIKHEDALKKLDFIKRHLQGGLVAFKIDEDLLNTKVNNILSNVDIGISRIKGSHQRLSSEVRVEVENDAKKAKHKI